MTWKSHILFAGTLAFALGFSPPEVLCISALSTLPDRMESIGPLRILRHRGISHDLALWIFLFLVALLLEVRGIVPRALLDAGTIPVIGGAFSAYGLSTFVLSIRAIPLGPLFHLLADMLTPAGVRFAGERISVPVCRTGHPSEYAVVAVLSAWWFLLGWYAARLDPGIIFFAGRAFVIDPAGLPVRAALAGFPVLGLLFLQRFSRLRAERAESGSGNKSRRTESPRPETLRVKGISGRKAEIRLVPEEDGTLVVDLRELKTLWTLTDMDTSEKLEKTRGETDPGPVREPGVREAEVGEKEVEVGEKEAEGENTSSENESFGAAERLRRLLFEYREDFERAGLAEAARRISEILLTEGAKAPSVAGKDPSDASRPRNQYDLLMRISLLEHSVDVAEKAIEIAKRKLPDGWRAAAVRLVLCALAHDLGKLPSISGDNYSTAGHPLHSAAFLGKLLKDHPWREDMAEIVKRHHERVDEKTPIELKILILADKEAREEEAERLSGGVGKPAAPMVIVTPDTGGPPETRPIPEGFPVERVLEKMLPLVNRVLENGAFVAFSQPDGVVYVQAETLHAAISEVARETGFTDEFFHSTEKPVKKSCLQSFYDEFRRRGWVPEKLVSERFYGNFFWVWNPRKQGFTRTFYVPFLASAFGVPLAELEKKRKRHPVLAALSIRGVAPPGSPPPHRSGSRKTNPEF